jgi:hypothetical protein
MPERTLTDPDSIDLTQFDELWTRSAATPEEPYSDIPDGAYEASITFVGQSAGPPTSPKTTCRSDKAPPAPAPATVIRYEGQAGRTEAASHRR